MIIDSLENADKYVMLHPGFKKGIDFLRSNAVHDLPLGKHEIEGSRLFAIIQEYDTLDIATEKMEAHRKYIDIQYVVEGCEHVGHDILTNQPMHMEYSEKEDYLLVASEPAFFTKFDAGMFMIFFPTDLHAPCLNPGRVERVKKVVVKVAVDY